MAEFRWKMKTSIASSMSREMLLIRVGSRLDHRWRRPTENTQTCWNAPQRAGDVRCHRLCSWAKPLHFVQCREGYKRKLPHVLGIRLFDSCDHVNGVDGRRPFHGYPLISTQALDGRPFVCRAAPKLAAQAETGFVGGRRRGMASRMDWADIFGGQELCRA